MLLLASNIRRHFIVLPRDLHRHTSRKRLQLMKVFLLGVPFLFELRLNSISRSVEWQRVNKGL